MGNGFCKNKQGLILIFPILFLLFSLTEVYASFSEFELFDKAYTNYISYRPEEAIKDFKTFLEEFPDSSAKDAVMFWLAKSLVHTKSFEEAEQIFSDIKKQFPESSFLPFVDKEIEEIKKLRIEAHKEPEKSEIAKTDNAFKTKLEEVKEELKIQENALREAVEERDKLKEGLSEQIKKTEELQERLTGLEQVDQKKQILSNEQSELIKERDNLSRLFEEEKRKTEELEKMLNELREEESKKSEEIDTLKVQLEQEIQNVRDLKVKLKQYEEKNKEEKINKDKLSENINRDKLESLLKEEKKKVEILQARVGELEEREKFVIISSFVLNKLGIDDVLWQSGDINDDFINESILYEKAKTLNINFDRNQYEKIVEKYRFNQDQAEYVKKYLVISKLINEKIKEMREEKFVDILSVKYGDDKDAKTILSRELLSHARNGLSFENIEKLYAGATYKTVPLYDLQDWIKERIGSLKNGDVGIVWLEDEYMLLRPVLRKISYNPLSEIHPVIKEKIRVFVRSWINELKKQKE